MIFYIPLKSIDTKLEVNTDSFATEGYQEVFYRGLVAVINLHMSKIGRASGLSAEELRYREFLIIATAKQNLKRIQDGYTSKGIAKAIHPNP